MSVRALARIEVTLKPGIADPQGQTVERSLPAMGWENVSEVRIGKHLELALEGESLDALREQVDEMCRAFLTNPVMEQYGFTLEEL
ncbi:MAG TPA: phosphoribosylformylglycinamidine synthase subunit PurS [Actinomycetota bacterium]|jgi:phosphoribosylformylglycinamidine synthase subunit PurS|nr:phosphoribosylformylglycinamidine synthase subunit PurS [Actinomycetota bacterium]